jgi:hypothetical protein
MSNDVQAAAERLRRLYNANDSYAEVYGVEQTGAGLQQRDEQAVVAAYLALHDPTPNEATQQLPDLETPCPICKGKGGSRCEVNGEWSYCWHCGGAGFLTTDFGGKVLSLLRHNFRTLYESMQSED